MEEAQPVVGVPPTDVAGEAPPVGSGPRSPLRILFLALCIGSGMLLHAEQLAAAAAAAAAAVCVVFSVTVLLNLAICVVASGRAAGAGGLSRQLLCPTASAGLAPALPVSKSLLAPFIGLCLAMGAALHAESLAAAAAEYQIDPAVVVCIALAGVALFHLAVLSIHKTLASHRGRGQDERKQRPRSRGLPLLPFVVLAFAISAASSVETVMADGVSAPDLPQDSSVWAALALAVSFNIAIGSLYFFIIDGPPPPPTAATVEPWSRTKSAGAMVSCITAAGIVSFLLLTSGGASGTIAARS